jgi:hypothetical protein
MDLAELAFDRSGHGPTKNVNVDSRVALVSRVAISRIKEEIASGAGGQLKPLPAPTDRGPSLGEVLDLAAIPAAAEAEGGESLGTEVPASSGGPR